MTSAEWKVSRVGSIARALRMLEAFQDAGPSLRLTDLADHAEIPISTAHRLAAVLIESGVLEKEGRSYRLGLRLFELGELVAARQGLRTAALPFLEDLYEATHATIHLAILQGTDVVYVEKIGGHGSASTPARVGGRLPAHSTSLGKAILAFSDASLVDGLLARPLARCTPYTVIDPGVLRSELDSARSDGIAFEREEARLGLGCAAAPILVPQRDPAGAVSASLPLPQANLNAIAPAVRTAALGISRALTSQGASSTRRFAPREARWT